MAPEQIYIIYPERRWVSPDVLFGWFADAVADNQIAPEFLCSKTLEDVAGALSDAGIITIGRPGL